MRYWLNQLIMITHAVQPKFAPSPHGRHPSEGWVLAHRYPMPAFARRALRGVIRGVCPPEPAPQLVDLEDRIEDHLLRFIHYMPAHVALGFCFAVLLLDWAPIWTFSAGRRLQHLERDRAAAIVAKLDQSRSPFLRTMLLGVRGSILSTYYDQDEVHRALDYAPARFIASRIDLRKRLLIADQVNAPPAVERMASLERRS
jgi:hypothetical protein